MGLARLIGWTTLMEDGGMVTLTTGQRRSNLASFSLGDWSTALGPYPVVPTPTQGTTMGRTRRRAPSSVRTPAGPFPFLCPFPYLSRAWVPSSLGESTHVPQSFLGCSGLPAPSSHPEFLG